MFPYAFWYTWLSWTVDPLKILAVECDGLCLFPLFRHCAANSLTMFFQLPDHVICQTRRILLLRCSFLKGRGIQILLGFVQSN